MPATALVGRKAHRHGARFTSLTEILSRLPVKSLVRLKCVAKSWKTLLGTSFFVSRQLLASFVNHKNYPLLLVFGFEKPCAGRKTLRLLSNGEPSPNFYKPFPDEHINAIYGPCNVIFLVELTWSLSLWNPATREVEVLQPPPPLNPFPDKSNASTVYGFGIDPKSIDFKIVKLMSKHLFSVKLMNKHLVWESEDWCIQPVIAEAYNVTTDSWRIVNDVPSSHCYTDVVSYANGVHRWRACALYVNRNGDGPLMPGDRCVRPILCFDISTQTFQEIEPPLTPDTIAIIDGSFCGDGIMVINNRISYHCVYSNSVGCLIEVATMNEYSGTETSWTTSTLTLLCEITEEKWRTFHGYWKDSELILSFKPPYPDILTSCRIDDSELQRVQEIPVRGGTSCKLREYTESIAPINVR